MITKQILIEKDATNKKLKIKREFDAPIELVWRAWTESELLEKWWAPKPWKAVTKEMHFREGGYWFYYMLGPNDERQYCKIKYKTIRPQTTLVYNNAFCDEKGKETTELPYMHWISEFIQEKEESSVIIEILFENEADLEKIIEMGFKEGFSLALENLDELLAENK